ncbi:MAG: hypothetical protein JWM87_4477 [Candidatus Eremiobacteraeota bacterium]|nr:hypothetical protein [Candidatus Eremiobacteraeota bacterium]
MPMGPNRLKYLEMLQGVITRMAGNEFSLRTWSVTLGTAVIGYAASKDGNTKAAFIAILPALVFWLLDAYFLSLERKFRALFNTAAAVQDDTPNFSFDNGWTAKDWLPAAFRPAVWLVHAPVIVVALLVGFQVFQR